MKDKKQRDQFKRIERGVIICVCMLFMIVIPAKASEALTSGSMKGISIREKTTESSASGRCGVNAYWKLDGNTLTVYGKGKIASYYDREGSGAPWHKYVKQISYLEIENGIEGIGIYSFAKLSNLQEIKLPESLREIKTKAFYECRKLESVIIPNSVEEIGDYAFGYIKKPYMDIEEGDYKRLENFIIHCSPDTEGYSYAINNGLKYREHLFGSATVVKPELENEGYMTYVCKDCGYTYTESIDGLEHEYESTVTKRATVFQEGEIVFICKKCHKRIERKIPMTELKKGIVFTQKGIVYEIISAKAGKLCLGVLDYTGKSRKVVIPDMVVLQNQEFSVVKVGREAFKDNKKVKEIQIGKNVREIGNKAFYRCSNLKKLVIKSNKVEDWGSKVFQGVYQKIKLKVPKKKVKFYKKLLKHDLPAKAKIAG